MNLGVIMVETFSVPNNLLQELGSIDIQIRKIEEIHKKELQSFLDHFKDFFMLCEGVKPSAESILTVCPPSKNITKDKFCLGVYKAESLVGFIDLIKDYPREKVLTIGYLLVHPLYRSTGIGSLLVEFLYIWGQQQGFKKLRLRVQKQNARALAFWQKNKFKITKTITESLGEKLNTTDILERLIFPEKEVCHLYENISDWFDSTRERDGGEKKYLEIVKEFLSPEGAILDLGCGTGEPIAQFFIEKGFKVTGIDGSQRMIDKC